MRTLSAITEHIGTERRHELRRGHRGNPRSCMSLTSCRTLWYHDCRRMVISSILFYDVQLQYCTNATASPSTDVQILNNVGLIAKTRGQWPRRTNNGSDRHEGSLTLYHQPGGRAEWFESNSSNHHRCTVTRKQSDASKSVLSPSQLKPTSSFVLPPTTGPGSFSRPTRFPVAYHNHYYYYYQW